MADAADTGSETAGDAPKKGSKLPLILGIVLALAGGGGGFMAVQTGMIGGSSDDVESPAEFEVEAMPSLAFVALDPLVVNMPPNAQARHLRFTAQLEVDPDYTAEVEALKPRVMDVLNGYLRAVEVAELEDPTGLIRMRAQMLRRVQVVVGEGRVKDLLIMEFVLN